MESRERGGVEGTAAEAAVLTAPLMLEGGLAAEHRAPNLLQLVLSLFRNLRPGSDITNLQLPPLFNMPKSQLQCYGEGVYCIGEDMLSRCARGKSSLERFSSVVAWSISHIRPLIFGMAPYNPILGETHHASRGTLNVLLEQVSHHPPVSALHATDEKENIELLWCCNAVPKFHGRSVEAVIKGKRKLRLLNFGENYEMDAPNLLLKILPVRGMDCTGNVAIRCKESGLAADLCYCKSGSFLGFGGNSRCVKGKIFHSESQEPIYEINGQWDSTVQMKDVHTGEITVLYDARKAIAELKTPFVSDPQMNFMCVNLTKECVTLGQGLWPSESAVVWSEVSRAILDKDWEKAREAKRRIEERERRLQRERKEKGEKWHPKHFTLTHTKERGWECCPTKKAVPKAPIIAPL